MLLEILFNPNIYMAKHFGMYLKEASYNLLSPGPEEAISSLLIINRTGRITLLAMVCAFTIH